MKNTSTPTQEMRLLSRTEVLEIIGVTYPALWGWIRDGKFPPGRALGFGRKGHVAWVEKEVMDWIASRPLRIPKPRRKSTEAA
jgi:predicted DNA-binding transcriptional regulator AlpA